MGCVSQIAFLWELTEVDCWLYKTPNKYTKGRNLEAMVLQTPSPLSLVSPLNPTYMAMMTRIYISLTFHPSYRVNCEVYICDCMTATPLNLSRV